MQGIGAAAQLTRPKLALQQIGNPIDAKMAAPRIWRPQFLPGKAAIRWCGKGYGSDVISAGEQYR